MRVDKNRISLSLKRSDLCHLLDALEAIIEDLKYDGGLILAEDYMALKERLERRLRSHDSTPYRSASSTAPEAQPKNG